ncbi:MAG: hypothetical protein KKB81_07245 [Candidatus Margulisbacteria bacterium]|nr:hypothetical protein [Candidatus Margulisiibacteriota bacterium]MBU1021150.1 hypothetical protein [Candidatus Margulisiibacteriota bacterium]MBU1729756.1 hypothetical protein [Candidatus Margulisiibacteriota bacterium]MBU1955257.1 hypothetical protein [Candidatus Margulisiibacteriota bacterium]
MRGKIISLLIVGLLFFGLSGMVWADEFTLPMIYGNTVVCTESDIPDTARDAIIVYDISSKQKKIITTGMGFNQNYHNDYSISGSKVVFTSMAQAKQVAPRDIYLYDAGSGAMKNLTNTPDVWEMYPNISGNQIVYGATSPDAPNNYHIVLQNIDTGDQQQITGQDPKQRAIYNDIDPVICTGYIVWTRVILPSEDRKIMAYNLSTKAVKVLDSRNKDGYLSYLRGNQNFVVWRRLVKSGGENYWQIVLYNLSNSTATNVISRKMDDYGVGAPDVYSLRGNPTVTWSESINTTQPTQYQICYKVGTGGSIVKVDSNNIVKSYPSIYGSKIAYRRAGDIYLYDTGTKVRQKII